MDTALLNYAFDVLKKQQDIRFQSVNVNDVLHLSTTKACGMEPKKDVHVLQYVLRNSPAYCVSGTAGIEAHYSVSYQAILPLFLRDGHCASSSKLRVP